MGPKAGPGSPLKKTPPSGCIFNLNKIKKTNVAIIVGLDAFCTPVALLHSFLQDAT